MIDYTGLFVALEAIQQFLRAVTAYKLPEGGRFVLCQQSLPTVLSALVTALQPLLG